MLVHLGEGKYPFLDGGFGGSLTGSGFTASKKSSPRTIVSTRDQEK